MTPFNIYIWQQADAFKSIFSPFGFLGWLSLVLLGISAIVRMAYVSDEGDNPEDPFLKTLKPVQRWLAGVASTGITLTLLAAAIPSSKTIALMVALPAIAKSEPIQQDLPEIYQLAKEALKEQLTLKK